MSEQNGDPPPIASPVPTGAIQSGVPVAQPVGPTLRKRGSALAGWLVVLAIVAGLIYIENVRPPSTKKEADREAVGERTDASIDLSLLALSELQARLILGANRFM